MKKQIKQTEDILSSYKAAVAGSKPARGSSILLKSSNTISMLNKISKFNLVLVFNIEISNQDEQNKKIHNQI
ncbi:MAG: hypothetical protein AC479_04785 [miscellaneous Crenarchaeota group-6 archaeon AD8-1]|nr:MAG: hypothetical protein AC479_04785 [miscellaneous Crenarchaeota group-6 archaeon AD8-1]